MYSFANSNYQLHAEFNSRIGATFFDAKCRNSGISSKEEKVRVLRVLEALNARYVERLMSNAQALKEFYLVFKRESDEATGNVLLTLQLPLLGAFMYPQVCGDHIDQIEEMFKKLSPIVKFSIDRCYGYRIGETWDDPYTKISAAEFAALCKKYNAKISLQITSTAVELCVEALDRCNSRVQVAYLDSALRSGEIIGSRRELLDLLFLTGKVQQIVDAHKMPPQEIVAAFLQTDCYRSILRNIQDAEEFFAIADGEIASIKIESRKEWENERLSNDEYIIYPAGYVTRYYSHALDANGKEIACRGGQLTVEEFRQVTQRIAIEHAKIIRDDLLRENLALDPSCEEIATVLRRCEAVLSRC